MNVQFEGRLHLGEEVTLSVQEHDGRIGFEPRFVKLDSEVDRYLLPNRSEDFGSVDDFDVGWNSSDLRSVRIFFPAEPVPLQVGESWHAKIENWKIKENLARDSRHIIHISVADLQRQLFHERRVEGRTLTLTMRCGTKTLRTRQILLEQRTYRFASREVGSDIVELDALGTETTPCVIVGMPRYFPAMEALVGMQSNESGTRWSFASPEVAAESIQRVSADTARRWANLPRVS